MKTAYLFCIFSLFFGCVKTIYADDGLLISVKNNKPLMYNIATIDSLSFNISEGKLLVNSKGGVIQSMLLSEVDSLSFVSSLPSQILDIDGNRYNSVQIGGNVWMLENLRTTRYRNGDLIGTTTPATAQINNQASPSYQWAYNGDEGNAAVYGRLYTFYAINDSRNIAPFGWHVATDAEWTELENYLIANGFNYDGSTVDNKIAKSLAATTLWGATTVAGAVGNNLNVNNSSGFTAIPAGSRDSNGSFMGNLNYFAHWWTGSSYSSSNAWGRSIGFDYIKLNRFNYDKASGWSVRCVKDK